MSPVVIQSRDRLSLVSFLTLPLAAIARRWKGEAKSPLVLLVHGGPWARDLLDFRADHQWLANRGYAVLSVNYRGSTGYGKSFVDAAVHQWAGKMHDDLIDAVDWAVREGITDRDSVAIMGGSYGGYAALVGLTFTPDRFACGIDIVGPSNLETLLDSVPPYWKSYSTCSRVTSATRNRGRAGIATRAITLESCQCDPTAAADWTRGQ